MHTLANTFFPETYKAFETVIKLADCYDVLKTYKKSGDNFFRFEDPKLHQQREEFGTVLADEGDLGYEARLKEELQKIEAFRYLQTLSSAKTEAYVKGTLSDDERREISERKAELIKEMDTFSADFDKWTKSTAYEADLHTLEHGARH